MTPNRPHHRAPGPTPSCAAARPPHAAAPARVTRRTVSAVTLLASAALLGACGGGADERATAAPAVAAPLASGATTLVLEAAAFDATAAAQFAEPAFHAAPVLLDAPADNDAVDPGASARRPPHVQAVPPGFEGLSTRRLTVQTLQAAASERRPAAANLGADGGAAPVASSVVATYSPAQIRAAYGLPALPAPGGTPTAAQAAQLGAGQTIYIVDANHDPNAAAELLAFNQKFGLPGCTTRAIAANASLPLAKASGTGCEFSVVYSTVQATMTASAPGYDAGWAGEIALDVQWAHATAPLARIVLIEAADASLDGLLGAIKLANAMGPGVVSMSFGAQEGSYTASVDAAFTATGMSYLAATGDGGAGVSWPAVSSHVLAVGGTTLTYSGSGARSESAWSRTGGGTSAYTPAPAYQNAAVPGLGTPVRRTVADVSFNADPNTGQYVAMQAPGSGAVSWLSIGGTSLSTPQWAGIVAVANALRAAGAQAALGAPHAVLYGQIGAVPGSYAAAFADVTKGSDGSCASCTAKAGYDALTGLGSPNAGALLTALTGAAVAASAPVVTAAAISGTAGTALTFTVSVAAPDPVTYALSGAPSGMTIDAAGAVGWARPVAGVYPVVVTARDGKTGLSGQGTVTVTIAAPQPPVVTAAAVSGKAGTALSFTVSASAPDPVTFSLANAPAGMAVAGAGVVTWAKPVAGSYAVTVKASDATTGLSGSAVLAVSIAAPAAPVVAAATVSGKSGVALLYTVGVTAANPLSYGLSGAPAGMTIGSTGTVSWPSPVAGSYGVTVTAKDVSTGLSGQAVLTVQIAAAGGPVITAAAMQGVAGRPMAGTVSISDPGATAVSMTISGAPMGMMFSVSGLSVSASWAAPVAGSYTLKIAVADAAGKTATATVPITIAAK